MKARRVERRDRVEPVIQRVEQDLEHRGDDPRPPRAAATRIGTLPSVPVTMMGDIDDSIRFFGAMAFGSSCTSP